MPLISAVLSRLELRQLIPDVVFGALDTGLLMIAVLAGAGAFGILGAIVGSAIGDAVTDGIAGFFEGGIAEWLREGHRGSAHRTGLGPGQDERLPSGQRASPDNRAAPRHKGMKAQMVSSLIIVALKGGEPIFTAMQMQAFLLGLVAGLATGIGGVIVAAMGKVGHATSSASQRGQWSPWLP